MTDRAVRYGNTVYIDGEFTTVESLPEPDMIICGYCETQQSESNPACQSCGGPLFDDVSNRRNGPSEPIKFGITTQEAVDAMIRMFG